MRVLGFDASGQTLSVGYIEGDAVLADLYWQRPKTAGSHLVAWIEMIVKEFGRPDGISVGIGPGSFTGVRIALSAAKALAYAWNVPVVGISSLQAWAYSIKGYQGKVFVSSEKRGPAFYAGLYFLGHNPFPEVIIPDWAVNQFLPDLFPLSEPVAIVGPVAADRSYSYQVSSHPISLQCPILGSRVAFLGQSRLQLGQVDDPMTLAPLYIRPPAISTPRGRIEPEGKGRQ
ncbi:MAG: tRNA (adenosine(37)-N6)-threonylcarbamoyltransferase complex dimerization subunit type 1 TsaB [Sulfobacillus thermosulfidooxidans]|uniref:tRNA (Adenosine(37)-N6)-threonylcarbamoyltransferase complex dimerization subunit type 1 TsaB n=1 Tax=Sulfobacillus thermosulfidooxidans TaxID=28034 RepID=A0A2T2X119_SULTH|nr:MAG: tRNA (adenosine(37)-N6)-threonylcarbamoyltransferase complex dimerization subunit type 1 TsaB [Sulfobacillus thermosulfidooxidans]